MTITMSNDRAVEIIRQIPIVAKSFNDDEPLNDLAEALVKAIYALENEKTNN